MELALHNVTLQSFSITSNRVLNARFHSKYYSKSCYGVTLKSLEQGRKVITISNALPETAASIAIAATVVGVATNLLIKRTKASEETEIPTKMCEACGGSGICSACRGEGFVLKRLSDEGADRARLNAKNMATRYTAGLPKKWSYCTKCSSSRSCTTCDGRGKLSL